MPANPRAASVRLKASKGSALVAILHDFRQGAQPAYIDAGRSAANSILQPAPTLERIYAMAEQRYADAARRREAATGQPLRKRRTDASPATTLILTFGADVQETLAAMSADDQDAALGAALDRVAAYLDAPVLWAAVHRDEAALHLHAGLCAVRGDGQAITTALQAHPDTRPANAPADWTSRPNTSDLQTELHAALIPYIAGIERGHRKVDRLKAGEPLEATKTQTHQMLKARLGLGPEAESTEVTAAVTRLRTATARAAAIDQEIAETTNQLEALQTQIADQDDALEAWHEKIDTLQPRIDRLKTKQAETGLTPREETRLGVYTRRLEGYHTAQAALDDKLAALRTEYQTLQADITTAQAALAADTATLTQTITDLTAQRDQLTGEVATQTDTLAELDKEAADAVSNRNTVQQEITDLTAETKQLTEKIDTQTDTLAKLDTQFAGTQAALQDKLTAAETQLETITQEITAGQKTLADLDRQAAAQRAAVATEKAALTAAQAARTTIETLEPASLFGPSKDQEYREAAIREAGQLAAEREQAHQGLLTRLATTIEEVANRGSRPRHDTPGDYEDLYAPGGAKPPPLLTRDDLDQTPRLLWARICDLGTVAAFNYTVKAITDRRVRPLPKPGEYHDLGKTDGKHSPWWQTNVQHLLRDDNARPFWTGLRSVWSAISLDVTLQAIFARKVEVRPTAKPGFYVDVDEKAGENSPWWRANVRYLLHDDDPLPFWDRVKAFSAAVQDALAPPLMQDLQNDLNTAQKARQTLQTKIDGHYIPDNGQLRKTNTSLTAEVETLKGQLDTAQTTIAARDTTITQLTEELKPHRDRAAARRAQQERERDAQSFRPPGM